MKIKPLLLSGVLALSSATPALAHGYYGDHNHPPVHVQPSPHRGGPSAIETILGIGIIGAGLWWGYGPDIEYEYDDKTYVLCNDFGRRYYC